MKKSKKNDQIYNMAVEALRQAEISYDTAGNALEDAHFAREAAYCLLKKVCDEMGREMPNRGESWLKR